MQPDRELALVTGASSGIGRQCALVLAERGFDLAITARRQDRLEELKGEIESQHGVGATVLVEDLSAAGGPERLADAVGQLGRPLSVLVNNAGFGYYGPVTEARLAEVQATIQVNVNALTTLVRLLAPAMRERRHGYILNVSSFAALQPIPLYAVYSGAKAYVVAFSLALRHELRRSGVKVTVVCPGFTATEFHDVARHRKTGIMRRTTLSSESVARQALAGMFRGKAMVVPGAAYKLTGLALRFLPRTWASAMAAAVVKN